MNKIRNFVKLPLRVVKLIATRHRYNHLVIHRRSITDSIPPALLVPLFCWRSKNALRRPSNLAIVLIHNRTKKTLMERSLDYLGITDYTVLRLPPLTPGKWRHTMKTTAMCEFLASNACHAEYILYVDADDALMCGDPATAISALESADCDMLVSADSWAQYHGLDRAKEWALSIAPKHGPANINTGVYIARAEFLREFLGAVSAYVTDNGANIPGLPPDRVSGRGDQIIFRFLAPDFYPRIKIDHAQRLAIR